MRVKITIRNKDSYEVNVELFVETINNARTHLIEINSNEKFGAGIILPINGNWLSRDIQRIEIIEKNEKEEELLNSQ